MSKFFTKLEVTDSVAESGLTTHEAQDHKFKYGDNCLSERKKSPWYVKLIHELTSLFALMLWGGSALCF